MSGARFACVASVALLALGLPWRAAAQERVGEVAEQVQETMDELAAARAVADSFHAALAAGDSAAAVAHLHPGVIIYEAGHAETLADYRAGHLGSDMEFAAAMESRPVEIAGWIDGDAAVLLRESRVRGTFRERSIDAISLETMVLERNPAGWKIRHIHWSSRPAGSGS